MQFYPQHYFGFQLDDEVAAELGLLEEYEDAQANWRHEDMFFEAFEEKFGVYPEKFQDTTYRRGGEIQGLEGFEWDTTYLCFDPDSRDSNAWTEMENRLQTETTITLQEGRWSELG